MSHENPVIPDPEDRHSTEHFFSHPVTGEPTTAKELLDEAHDAIRYAELRRQELKDEVEPTPLLEEEIPAKAQELLDKVATTINGWDDPVETDLEGNRVLRDYSLTLKDLIGGGIPTTIRAQLVFPTRDAVQPTYGNVTVFRPIEGQVWPREFYFEARAEAKGSSPPYISVSNYPYHEEDLAKPDKNTADAVMAAEDIIKQLPRFS